jgi:hypothetical protein
MKIPRAWTDWVGLRGLCLLLAGAALWAVPGCQHRAPDDMELDPNRTTVPFQPMAYLARVRAAEGPYPNLYAGDTYALWVGPEVTAQRKAEAEAGGVAVAPEADAIAPIIEERFVVIECHLISMFADMSIGYDVVGLRNVEVYLENADGQRVDPVQVLVGGQLEEVQQGALRLFRRSCLVVFPKDALVVTVPVAPNRVPATRLVLAALDTEFYFEWMPVLRAEDLGVPLRDRAWVQAGKLGYNQFFGALQNVSHTFD